MTVCHQFCFSIDVSVANQSKESTSCSVRYTGSCSTQIRYNLVVTLCFVDFGEADILDVGRLKLKEQKLMNKLKGKLAMGNGKTKFGFSLQVATNCDIS